MMYKVLYDPDHQHYRLLHKSDIVGTELIIDTDIPPIQDRNTAHTIADALSKHYTTLSVEVSDKAKLLADFH